MFGIYITIILSIGKLQYCTMKREVQSINCIELQTMSFINRVINGLVMLLVLPGGLIYG